MSASAPTSYDPDSPHEHVAPVTPPPPVTINPNSILQPALSRRGVGPGAIVVLPDPKSVEKGEAKDASGEFDPNPVKKWAEEGFSIVAITLPERGQIIDIKFDIIQQIEDGIRALKSHWSVNRKETFALIIYDNHLADSILDYLPSLPPQITALLAFSPSRRLKATNESQISYYTRSQADPQMPLHLLKQNEFDPLLARTVRTANLEFLKEKLGGPRFELEAIWEEHTKWEFEERSVAQTVNTMVDDAYVNHVPTMTGGRGREALTAFYRDHFIFCNPPDTSMKAISRTVGSDRVIDEFIFSCTHTRHIPWLIPNIPPTNRPLSIPMVAVINFRGDRLCHEHIWWDQSTVLRQLGILPDSLPLEAGSEEMVRLPVLGAECADVLLDEKAGRHNELMRN